MRNAFGLFPVLLSFFVLALGVGVCLALALRPSAVAPGFEVRNPGDLVVQAMLLGRVAAMGVVLLVALLSREPALLALAFLGRLGAELGDAVGAAAAGMPALALPAAAGVGLDALAVALLVRRARSAKRRALAVSGP